ncbi:MAG: S1 RNA-binding domain-containing protein, partial [Limnohabitans sp.]|nr:S1 RNA-binding domain-containing protein [Limnohabitans sp.]
MSEAHDSEKFEGEKRTHPSHARSVRDDHGALSAGISHGSNESNTHALEVPNFEAANVEAPEFETPEFAQNPGIGFGFTEADDLAAEILAESTAPSHHASNDPSHDASHDDTRDATTLESADDEDAASEASDAADAAAAYARASMRDFDRPLDEPPSDDSDETMLAHRGEKPKQLVVVNDVPGEETRIAILEQGKLAQFFTERAATSTNVGSIYKARVVNVEPAIQAAFVDFGEGANGFLHISDLHPKYFPKKHGHGHDDDGDEDGNEKVRTEKVGRKIPRRARPMMQEALKR